MTQNDKNSQHEHIDANMSCLPECPPLDQGDFRVRGSRGLCIHIKIVTPLIYVAQRLKLPQNFLPHTLS